MDLASFIPGIGPTATFSPGATTPPPFNVTHLGLTDGTGPTTASNNMAEVYNRLLLNVAATISAAGLTIDNNNWTQLPAAVKAIADASVSAFTSTIVTPPQFDNTTKVATTQFVQRALGNYRSVGFISTNTTLTAANAGGTWAIPGASAVATINTTGLVPGATYTFVGNVSTTTTIAATPGLIRRPDGFQVPAITLQPKSTVQLVWDGSDFILTVLGALGQTNYVASDLAWVRFESGLMLQWGLDLIAIGETSRTILFPTNFNSSGFKTVMLTGRSTETINNNNVPQLVSVNASQFTYFNQGIVEPTTPLNPNQGIHWLAIGFAP